MKGEINISDCLSHNESFPFSGVPKGEEATAKDNGRCNVRKYNDVHYEYVVVNASLLDVNSRQLI